MVDLFFGIIFILLGLCSIALLTGLCIISFNIMVEIIKDTITVKGVEE